MPWRPSASSSTPSPASGEAKPEEDKIKSTPVSRLAAEQHGSFGERKEATPAKEVPVQRDEPTATATSASSTSSSDSASSSSQTNPSATADVPHSRSLAWRNFEQALKEITPSASESLGSLAELRKWNDEFGEGRKTKKKQVWGKGRFGFTLPAIEESDATFEPAVATPTPATTTPTPTPTTAHSNTGLEH